MALTRSFLKAMGLDEEKINSIIENHSETVDALKKERDGYKAQAEAAAEVAKERDNYKEQLSKAGDVAKVQADFDAYRQKVEGEKVLTAKRAALLSLAEKAGVTREQFRNAIAKAWDMDSLEIDDNGVIKDADGVSAAIQKDYADFIGTPGNPPVPKVDPPAGGGKSYTADELRNMSAEEINKNWDNIKGSLGNIK